MLFAENLGETPAFVSLDVPAEWTMVELQFVDFPGVDLSGLTAIMIGQAGQPGAFEFYIDDVEIFGPEHSPTGPF